MEYESIILGPGSEKGFLLIGAILALSFSKIQKIIGVSVGSILATLIFFNLSFPELLLESLSFKFFNSWTELVKDFNFAKWIEIENKNAIFGLIDPSKIKERIDYWSIIKFGKSITFKELYLRTGKVLVIVSTDRSKIHNPKPIYFNYLTTPDYLISQAVLESCLIPGIFQSNTPERIDGVFSDPLPIEQIGKENALVFLLSNNEEELEASITGILINIYNSLLVPIQVLLNLKLKSCPENIKVIKLQPKKGIPLLTGKEERIEMIIQGFFQTRKFFETIS